MEQENKSQKNESSKMGEAFNKPSEERIVRILSKDIEGRMDVYPGLTKIKGISWGMSNAICKTLRMNKDRKIGSLTEDEINKITEFMKSGKLKDFTEKTKIPKHLVNRRSDFEVGEHKHLVGSDLDLQKDFDIKRLKKIKSYRGFRHMGGLPTRGQRTKSNFRKNKSKGAGIKKKGKKK